MYLYVMFKCVCEREMRVLIKFFLKKKEGSFQERFFYLIYGITEDQRACITCFEISGLKETQMCSADFWTQRERERVG